MKKSGLLVSALLGMASAFGGTGFRTEFPVERAPLSGGSRRGNAAGGGRPTSPLSQKKIKERFLAQSTAEGNRLAKEKANAKVYRAWLATLSAEDLAFAKANGIDSYLSELSRPPSVVTGSEEHDSTEQIHSEQTGTHNGRPIAPHHHPVIDLREPPESRAVDQLSTAQVRETSETFGVVLRWALDGEDLVKMGLRSSVVIACLRTDLAGGLLLDHALARTLICSFDDFRLSETMARLRETGTVYGRFLEWMRRAQTVSGMGERLKLVAYKLRPDLLDAATLEQLGEATNKTRQSQSKIAGCLRDTFQGLTALCERPEITRLRCQIAQLAQSPQIQTA